MLRKRAHFKSKKNQNSESESQEEKKRSETEISTKIIVFAVDQNSYELRDIWILDSGANSHICNNPSRFKFERTATENDKLIAGKTVYFIEAFGSVNISIQTSTDLETIILFEVILASNFFINTVSLYRFTIKGVYWNTEKQRLYYQNSRKTFCTI